MAKISMGSDESVDKYLASLDEQSMADSRVLIEIMRRISGEEPRLWNIGTIGFSSYHYKYDSGREGDSFILGFYPRKAKITVYVMDGTARYTKSLSELGKHTTTGYCIYVKQLSDIELSILTEILENSYSFITMLSKNGPIDRILWKTEK